MGFGHCGTYISILALFRLYIYVLVDPTVFSTYLPERACHRSCRPMVSSRRRRKEFRGLRIGGVRKGRGACRSSGIPSRTCPLFPCLCSWDRRGAGTSAERTDDRPTGLNWESVAGSTVAGGLCIFFFFFAVSFLSSSSN